MIKNKYYSADVHLPEQVFGLHKARTRFEPEVALAIAPGSEPPYHDDPPEGPDPYLADHGFEHI
ncbi:hypothetical protein EDB89DRAFT_1985478, partial [Lactarius sanguifluus]